MGKDSWQRSASSRQKKKDRRQGVNCGFRISDFGFEKTKRATLRQRSEAKKAGSGQLAAGRRKKAKDREQMISDFGLRI